jgi:hypothetical protein
MTQGWLLFRFQRHSQFPFEPLFARRPVRVNVSWHGVRAHGVKGERSPYSERSETRVGSPKEEFLGPLMMGNERRR